MRRSEKSFGQKVKKLRLQQKMTQRELAQKLNISTRTLINYENGVCYPRSGGVVSQLTELFHVSADYLLSDRQTVKAEPQRTLSEEAGKEACQILIQLLADGRGQEEQRDQWMEALQKAYWEGKHARKQESLE